MKIGELSRITGVNIPTIRYYIDLGLLVPEQAGKQFLFNEKDLKSLELINKYKAWGFKLSEIHKILTLNRINTGVEYEENADYIDILSVQRTNLIRQKADIERQIEEISGEIESRSADITAGESTGVPLKALDILCCPRCGKKFRIRNADMNMSYIFNGQLSCECGFAPRINNGIIYIPSAETDLNDSPDTLRDVYRSCPDELMSLIQRSYNWMSQETDALPDKDSRVILETHLNSFFYLYKHFDHFSSNDIFILQDKFPEVIELYKKYLDRTESGKNIIYIVSDINDLPLVPNCVDLFIDYNSTNEHALFRKDFLPDKLVHWLKKDAFIVGTYFYFKASSASAGQLKEKYPSCQTGNYTYDYFFSGISRNYSIVRKSEIGSSSDSGDGLTFSFHKNGEYIYLQSYLAKRKQR